MAASMSIISSSPPLITSKSNHTFFPSASLTLLTGRRSNVSVNVTSNNSLNRHGLLHCAFISPSSSISFPSSFSGTSLGLDLNANIAFSKKRGAGLVVRAKVAMACTKRSRSRKSLARTHGFRLRMRTTSGRAMLKRRRAKGRWVLCTKTNPNSGKRHLK